MEHIFSRFYSPSQLSESSESSELLELLELSDVGVNEALALVSTLVTALVVFEVTVLKMSLCAPA